MDTAIRQESVRQAQTQTSIPAYYMRGGTSKGVFFTPADLPSDKTVRDAVLMRVIGSPDPYGKQIDGMGAATSSTSKVVMVGPSTRDDCDVEYWFGQVAIGQPLVDWSGNCGNLTAAVGPFAIHRGLVKAPQDGVVTIRIWQGNLGKKIVARVPVRNGQVQELGEFELDGVTFPAAEIPLTFLDPGADDEEGGQGGMFPTGKPMDVLDVPGVGSIEVTLLNAGNPTVMIDASALGLKGTEAQGDVNGQAALLAKLEAIRAHSAVAMGLAPNADEATRKRPNTPKLAFFGKPADYTASSGKPVAAAEVDIVARIMSMGQMHHAMTGTGAVAIAAAAAVPGTIVSRILGSARAGICFGHASGRLQVGAETEQRDGQWAVANVTLSRSARRLMVGMVFVPESAFEERSA